jgi:hypothetical protein
MELRKQKDKKQFPTYRTSPIRALRLVLDQKKNDEV